ncbi:MAG: 50S ribosomal protein L29 [Candidatus Buchananbacteria bacterium]|nr:50S ribosomal protein L29 [Candidatus Buchananbacteria bacterium]
MKFKELKTKTEKELQKLLADFRLNLRELKFKSSADQLKNVRELRRVKRNIAQILMLLSNKHQAKPEAEVKNETN